MAIGGLGAGLDSLFSDNTNEIQVKKTLRTSEIEPNRDQPRKSFSEDAIASLAESIREHGMLQPILVRPLSAGGYQIVAGERRWRAARMLGLDEVPVNIRELSDTQTMQIAVIENLQRENLSPVEEANGYCDLIEKYGMTQEQVAKMVGRSRSAVANAVRILSLPDTVLYMLETGSLSVGHAKVLLTVIEDVKFLKELAEKASDGKMTVRQLENEIRRKENALQKEREIGLSDKYFAEMEIALNMRLGRKVKVNYAGKKGSLVLEFYDKDDLKEIAEKLAGD
ncbi:MAG: ParB/RepB/Spo0J family partition protein [Ruminococcus flavefaciens]|nr:ParB/RepB/Spo0J family partition protein [Ruminococcus flavefaciens]